MSEVDKAHADIYFLPEIDNPTQEQLDYFSILASAYDDVAERGGMTAEQAIFERNQILGRIGMKSNISKPSHLRSV